MRTTGVFPAVCLGLSLLLHSPLAFAGTLGEVLRSRSIPTKGLAAGDLDGRISGPAILDDPHTLLIAYYQADASASLTPPLIIRRLQKSGNAWRHTQITPQQLPADMRHCFGSVVEVRVIPTAVYVGTHVNPSAGCTFVLSSVLAFSGVLPGWPLAVFGDGRLVYHRSQIHFAPTHAAEISLYYPRSGQSGRIYPRKPYQALRLAHIAKIRQAWSDPDWCQRENHHCDPEQFDNHLVGTPEVRDATDALAFVIAFDNTVTWTEAERNRLRASPDQRAALPPEAIEVVYIYRNLSDPRRLEYREILRSALTRRLGDVPLQRLLEPEHLRILFSR